MIVPLLAHEPLLADIAAAPEADGSLHLWWLGQSGFLLKWQRHFALLDPYLSDSLTRKYAGTGREHVRLTERCLAPEQLEFVPLAFSSHLHTDHCDPETLGPLAQAVSRQGRRLTLILPRSGMSAAQARLSESPVDYLPINEREEVRVGAFRIKAVAAAHPTVARDEQSSCLFLGFVICVGDWTIYHSGDTLLHPGLLDDLRGVRPDVALLPINGNRPERGVAGNLNGEEAAMLAHEIGAALAIPCHFGMFEFNTEPPDEFLAACHRLGQPHRVLRCGERLSLGAMRGAADSDPVIRP